MGAGRGKMGLPNSTPTPWIADFLFVANFIDVGEALSSSKRLLHQRDATHVVTKDHKHGLTSL
ncbi:MAG: hypothetical protein NVS9B15_05430 [Acidobacteriaceae bacterium]